MPIQGMGRRKHKSADEYDVYSGWRQFMCWCQRAGATSGVKRRTRRRERRETKHLTVSLEETDFNTRGEVSYLQQEIRSCP